MRRSLIGSLAGVLLWTLVFYSCSDSPSAPAPGDPAATLLTLGNGHFFFEAPLGAGGENGDFNPRLLPVVEICRLDTSSQPTQTTPCAELIVRYETGPGDRTSTVQIDVHREMYFVNWDLSRFTLPDGYYRIHVLTAPSTGAHTLLGIADVAVAPSRQQAHALAGPDVLAATNTQTIPVKFRIEEGAICGDVDCFEGTVDGDGGVFVTGEAQAGVDFPAGVIDGARTLVIERVDADDVAFCLPTHHPQYEGCYRYRLEPALGPGETFDEEVIVGVCLDPDAYAFEDELQLQKWDEVDPASLQALPRREIDFLECEGFLSSASGDGFWSRLAHGAGRLLAPVANFLGPKPAYAGRSPFGGGLNDFSLIGWVRPLAIEVAAGDDQEACADEAVAQDPTVRVTSLVTGVAIAGVPVSFDVTLGGGSASPADDHTNGDGLASTGWTLGDEGAQRLRARGLNPLSGWPQWTDAPPVWGAVEFEATAAAPVGAQFLSPFGAATTGSSENVSGLHPVLELCALDGSGQCTGDVTTFDGFIEYAELGLYRIDGVAPALAQGTVYRLGLVVDGRVAGSVRITADRALDDDTTIAVSGGSPFSVKVALVRGAGCD